MLGSVALPTQSAGNMSSLFFLLSFIIVNVAVIRLRRERPDMHRPYEMPLYPLPPLIGVALNLVLTVVLIEYLIRTDPLALGLSVGWIVLGGVAYLLLRRIRSRTERERERGSEGGAVTDTEMTPEGDD
jgi:amino acid transporter